MPPSAPDHLAVRRHPAPAPGDAEPLMQLVYTSQAADPMTPQALDALLADCRRRNREAGVTGVLMVHQGNILQCLEGRPEVVAETFARIARDRRHHAIAETYRGAIAERSFPAWYMACAHVDASWWLKLSTTAWETFRLAGHAETPGLAFLDAAWDRGEPAAALSLAP